MTDQPYEVVAVTRYDGWVTLSRHETKDERDKALSHERAQFATNGTEDVERVIGVTVMTKPVARSGDIPLYEALVQETLNL